MTRRGLPMWAGLGAAGVGLAFMGALPTAAADLKKEIATAEQHAGYAQGADQLEKVHAHLHHVVNCLVGPDGKGFDAKELNPCKDFGGGAIADTTDADQKKELHAAVRKARAGLKAEELAAAQKDAGEAEAMLKKLAM